MTDFFAELGFPRSAWLEPEEVKACHHRLIAAAHPDKPGGGTPKAALLNEARRILESPPDRLRHLTSLLAPDFTPAQKALPDWDLFSTIGEATREATTLADQLARTSSPIVRAGLLSRAKASEQRLTALKSLLQERKCTLEKSTRALQLDPFDAATTFELAEKWTFVDRLTASLHRAATALKTA